MKTKMILISLAVLFGITTAQAQDSTTCAGLLLKNHISVRAEGMGGAQTALAVDESGAHDFNPAGLAGSGYQRFSATYYSGLVDDAFGALAYDLPLRDQWVVGATFIYYDAGMMELNTLDGTSSQVSAQKDMLGSAALAKRAEVWGQNIDFGANLKVLHSTLVEEYSALAAAVDLGVRCEIKAVSEGLHAALALKNLGTPLKYIETADALPMYLLTGAAYALPLDDTFAIQAAVDLHYDLERNWRGNVGVEITISDLLALRGGYKLGYDLGAVTAGAGVTWSNISLNYAFNLMEVMNSVHRISIGYTLAPSKAELAAVQKAREPEKSQEELLEEMVENMEVTAKPAEGMGKIQAQVLQINRKAGVAHEVIMDKGATHGVKIGFSGSVYDKNGAPIAGILIRQVDPEISLAEIMGLSKDMDQDVWAVIEVPAEK